MIEWTLEKKHAYIQNVKTEDSFSPNCDFFINATDSVATDVIVTDVDCNDYHTYTYSSKIHYHTDTYLGEDIFSGMNIITEIKIDWDDSPEQVGLTPGGTYTHQYTSAGDYNIIAKAVNGASQECNQSWVKRIYWRQPSADFNADNWSPDPQNENGLGVLVTFTNTSTDPDGRRSIDGWNYDWVINDTGTYGTYTDTLSGVLHAITPTHAWRNPGDHDIKLTLNWYDGFSWQTVDIIKQITQNVWEVVNGLTWPIPVIKDLPTTYTPNISGEISHVYDIDYDIEGTPTYIGLNYDETFDHTFIISGFKTITQIINYHDGFSLQHQSDDFIVDMEPVASFEERNDKCGGIIFTSTSIAGVPPIISYKWEVWDNKTDVMLAELEGPTYQFRYTWPYLTEYKIILTVTDSDNSTDSHEKVFDVQTCPMVQSTGGGGLADLKYIDDNDDKEKEKKQVIVVAKYIDKQKVKTRKIRYKKIKNKYLRVSGKFKRYINKK